MGARLDQLVAAQDALMAAIDSGEATAIESATARLRAALDGLSAAGFQPGNADPEQLNAACEQNVEMAKRVNHLTERTASRLERLRALRGEAPAAAYGNC